MVALGRALMSRPSWCSWMNLRLVWRLWWSKKYFVPSRPSMNREPPILLVEQNAMAALNVAHYAYVLETGRVILEGAGRYARCGFGSPISVKGDECMSSNAFQSRFEEALKGCAPLAERMRPVTIEEFVAHLLGRARSWIRYFETKDSTPLFSGDLRVREKPPWPGLLPTKPTPISLPCRPSWPGTTKWSAMEEAQGVWAKERKRTWLFMDEIHRLNKAQQDTLLRMWNGEPCCSSVPLRKTLPLRSFVRCSPGLRSSSWNP